MVLGNIIWLLLWWEGDVPRVCLARGCHLPESGLNLHSGDHHQPVTPVLITGSSWWRSIDRIFRWDSVIANSWPGWAEREPWLMRAIESCGVSRNKFGAGCQAGSPSLLGRRRTCSPTHRFPSSRQPSLQTWGGVSPSICAGVSPSFCSGRRLPWTTWVPGAQGKLHKWVLRLDGEWWPHL